MGEILVGSIIGSLVGALVGVLAAAPVPAAARTITGQLVDAACYHLDHSNIGANHKISQGIEKDCAVACVKTGLPVALLTSDARVYIVKGAIAADNNAKLLPFMSQTVTLAGDVSERAGTIMASASDMRIVSK
jgi:hypothetical protein